MPRRRIDAVPAVPKVNRIEIRLEDLRLVVAPFHIAGRTLLSQLAPDGCITAIHQIRMHVADELLRDRAGTARVAHHGVLHGSGDTHQIDTVVLVETLVLNRNERLTDMPRQRRD